MTPDATRDSRVIRYTTEERQGIPDTTEDQRRRFLTLQSEVSDP